MCAKSVLGAITLQGLTTTAITAAKKLTPMAGLTDGNLKSVVTPWYMHVRQKSHLYPSLCDKNDKKVEILY